MLFGISIISPIRLGKPYFAEAFALRESHGNIYAKPVLHLESELKQERSWQISLFSFGLSGCLYFSSRTVKLFHLKSSLEYCLKR